MDQRLSDVSTGIRLLSGDYPRLLTLPFRIRDRGRLFSTQFFLASTRFFAAAAEAYFTPRIFYRRNGPLFQMASLDVWLAPRQTFVQRRHERRSGSRSADALGAAAVAERVHLRAAARHRPCTLQLSVFSSFYMESSSIKCHQATSSAWNAKQLQQQQWQQRLTREATRSDRASMQPCPRSTPILPGMGISHSLANHSSHSPMGSAP